MTSAHGSVVYILRCVRQPAHHYTGVTDNFRRRLAEHNAGHVRATARYRPWRPIAAIWLPDRQRALAFERYLKSGSGRAFAKRHF